MSDKGYLPPLPAPVAPTQREDKQLHVRELWAMFLRNAGVIIASIVLAIGAALLYAHRATRIYQGFTSIRIEDRQSTLPVLDVLKQISTGNGNEISTEMEVLRSRTLAESVADSLGLRVQLLQPLRVPRQDIFALISVPRSGPSGNFSITRASDRAHFVLRREDEDKPLATARIGEPFHIDGATITLGPGAAEQPLIRFRLQAFESAVGGLSGALIVTRPSREANVVVVSYRSTDPVLASDVPNALAQSFITRRQVIKKAESHSTVQFLTRQIDTLNRQLAQAEDSLKDFRERAQVISLGDEATAQVKRLAELQADRSSVEAERTALGSLLEEVRAQRASPTEPSPYRRLLAFPSLLKNQSVTALFQALTTVEDERANLLIRRTPVDPDVMVLTNRVHDLEDQIRVLATTYYQGLGAQVASMDRELSTFSGQLQEIPAKEVQYARLERRPKVLDDVYTMLQSRLKEAEIAEAVADPSVRVIDPAIVPDMPIKPNKQLVLVSGVLFGLLLGCGAAFLRENMDRGLHTSEDVQRVTGRTVLALIPHIHTGTANNRLAPAGVLRRLSSSWRPASTPTSVALRTADGSATQFLGAGLITGIDPRSPVSEAYRTLRTNITFARAEDAPRMVVFTSAMPGDGKSTTTANLTVTLAQAGTRVLLIDADMRRGMLHAVFGFARDRGLSDLVLGAAPLEKLVKPVRIGDAVAFDFLSTGTLPPNPSELLGSRRMRDLLAHIQEQYDMVVIDSPPVNMVTDAAVLGTVADGVIVVARAGVTSDADLSYAMSQIDSVRAPVLGIVLNDVDFRRDARYQGNYGYQQYHYYASGDTAAARG